MDPTDPNTGIPLYDPCHMYPSGSSDYSSCFANGGTLPDPVTVTHWYDQAWFPVTTIGLLVVLIGIVGFYAYARIKATK
jgi:hypothetical protein